MIAKILIALLSITALVSAQAILASPNTMPPKKNDALDTRDIDEFKKFLTSINKVIKNPDEFKFRLNLYLSKKKEIDAFNKLNLGYTKGLNQFAIMTDEEKSKYTGEKPFPQNEPTVNGADINEYEENGNLNQLTKFQQVLNNINSLNRVFPQKKDWAAEGKITPTKNQKMCGSCWAFAAVAAVEAAYKIKSNLNLDFSEQELVDCSRELGSNGCEGGYVQGALEYFKAFGVRFDLSYPYTAKNGSCQARKRIQPKIKSYTAVDTGNILNYINNLKLQPLITIMRVPKGIDGYKNGIIPAKMPCTDFDQGLHAVLAVGYDLSAKKPYIKFKNSWGTGWGESGFFKIEIEKVISQDGRCNVLLGEHPSFFVNL